MLLGVVVGELWATRKSSGLDAAKLLFVQPCCSYGDVPGGHIVAIDKLGAGVGEHVVVCFGSPARWQHGGSHLPVDAAVMAIIDRAELSHSDPRLPHRWHDAETGPRPTSSSNVASNNGSSR